MLAPFYRGRPFALSLTRVRAACEQAKRIKKNQKIASFTRATRKNEKERERPTQRDGAVFRLHGTEIPRMLSIFGKTMPRIRGWKERAT